MSPKYLFAFLFSLFSFLLPSFAAAPSLMPDERVTIELRPNERNPFTQTTVQDRVGATPDDSASEEARLRRILRAVKIAGVSGSRGEFRALLGSIIVRPGDTLPPIIDNQSEVLRVVTVDEAMLTLAFVERDPTVDIRKIELPIAMKPVVSQFVYGEAVESLLQISQKGAPKLPALDSPEVSEFLKNSQALDLRNVADRNVKMMGGVRDAEIPEP